MLGVDSLDGEDDMWGEAQSLDTATNTEKYVFMRYWRWWMMADDGHEFTLGDVGKVALAYEGSIDRRAAAFSGTGTLSKQLHGVDAGFLAAVASFLREFGESKGSYLSFYNFICLNACSFVDMPLTTCNPISRLGAALQALHGAPEDPD